MKFSLAHLAIALAVTALLSFFPPMAMPSFAADATTTATSATTATSQDATQAAATTTAAADTASAAAATTASGYEIHATGTAPTLIQYLASALEGLLIGVVVWVFGTKGKIKLGDEAVTAIDGVIHQAVAYGQSKATAYTADLKNPTVQNQVVAEAVNFVLDNVPTLVAHLGLTADDVEDKIKALINKADTTATTATNTTAQAAT